ncbi:MAG: hypothetical protein GY913_01890 [Proteobacteria bacterium]|nr:hypothetical protein [Pseudomonadota bacterium]MCP4915652.1 hypothetical protein [Pseudomonadota bacterium]
MWLTVALMSCGPAPTEPEAAPAVEAAPVRPLVEVLYEGERTPNARGDRIRLLVWLRGLDASDEELRAIRGAAQSVANAKAELDAGRAAAQIAEEQAFGAAYSKLEHELIEGIDDERAAELADEVEASRVGLHDPRELHVRYVEVALEHAGRLVDLLGPDREQGLADALFVLRAEVAPTVRPALYDGLLGRPWSPGDFSTLRRSASDREQGQLDPGGLFELEGGTVQTNAELDRLRLTTLVAMVLEDPQLVDVLDALLGETPGVPDEAAESPPL